MMIPIDNYCIDIHIVWMGWKYQLALVSAVEYASYFITSFLEVGWFSSHSYTPEKVFVYNATISACEKSGHWQHALRLFQLMTFTQVFPTVA